jgi:hypothetical protein
MLFEWMLGTCVFCYYVGPVLMQVFDAVKTVFLWCLYLSAVTSGLSFLLRSSTKCFHQNVQGEVNIA